MLMKRFSTLRRIPIALGTALTLFTGCVCANAETSSPFDMISEKLEDDGRYDFEVEISLTGRTATIGKGFELSVPVSIKERAEISPDVNHDLFG